MEERITEMIVDLREMMEGGDNRPFIPPIIETLEAMLACFENDETDQKTLKYLTSGLGRLVTDDFEFSESPIGNKLLLLNSDVIHTE
jgi:hypothetical protein